MKIPMNLEHKPVFIVEDYYQVDGYNGEETTDAQGLSIGIAQWSGRHNFEISSKIWRYTGKKWSRQSEELPLHRLLDLTTFLCLVLNYVSTGIMKPSINIQGKNLPIGLVQDKYSDQDLKDLKEFIDSNKELLDDRLKTLSRNLKDLGY